MDNTNLEPGPFAHRGDAFLRHEPPGWRPGRELVATAAACAAVTAAIIGPPVIWEVFFTGGCPELLREDAMTWLDRVSDRLAGGGTTTTGICDTVTTPAVLRAPGTAPDIRAAITELGCRPPPTWQWWRVHDDCEVKLAHGRAVAELWVRPRTGTVEVRLHR